MPIHGTTTIAFEIERVKDPKTGDLRVERPGDPIDIEPVTLQLSIRAEGAVVDGFISADPDSCSESVRDAEIKAILLDGEPWPGELTKVEEAQVREFALRRIIQEAADAAYDDY